MSPCFYKVDSLEVSLMFDTVSWWRPCHNEYKKYTCNFLSISAIGDLDLIFFKDNVLLKFWEYLAGVWLPARPSSVDAISLLLGCDSASLRNWFPTFRGNVVSSWRFARSIWTFYPYRWQYCTVLKQTTQPSVWVRECGTPLRAARQTQCAWLTTA
jgi:hypothetical protein